LRVADLVRVHWRFMLNLIYLPMVAPVFLEVLQKLMLNVHATFVGIIQLTNL
jgi:hypothetical protein